MNNKKSMTASAQKMAQIRLVTRNRRAAITTMSCEMPSRS